MYDTFYGFREKPFALLPDPDYLYLSPQHEKALGLLELSLHNQAGFCVISGDIGAGKTTLVRKLLTLTGAEFRVGLVSNTLDSFGDLMSWILMAFGLRSGGGSVEQHERLIDFIIQEYGRGRRTVLIIDEAQNLGVDALEELRMLSNVNADKHQVLQVILVGQAGLRETLRRPELVQFVQRVLMDFHLGPMGREDTVRYIRHRLLVAGADPRLFSEEAAAAVFRYSGGVPRIINLLCDTALVYSYAEGSAAISGELIHAVARERQSSGVAPALRLAAVAPPAPTEIRGLDLPDPVVPDLTVPRQGAAPRETTDATQAAPVDAEAVDDREWLHRLADSVVPPALRDTGPRLPEAPVRAEPAAEDDPLPPRVVPARKPTMARRRGGRALAVLLLAAGGVYWLWGEEVGTSPQAAPEPAALAPVAAPEPEPERGAQPPRVRPPLPVAPAVAATAEAEKPVEPPSIVAEPRPVAAPAPQASPTRATTGRPAVEAVRQAAPGPRPVPRPASAARAAPNTTPAPAVPASPPAPVVQASEPVPSRFEPGIHQEEREAGEDVPQEALSKPPPGLPAVSETRGFTTDPCRGPAAHYLSTCR